MSEEEVGGGGPGRSQEEGACVDTGNYHTEAKMSPAQVPSRTAQLSIIDSAQLCTLHAHSCLLASIEPVSPV